MFVELIGATSSGKSTLFEEISAASSNGRARPLTSYQFVLRRFGLQWIKHRGLRAIFLNLIAIVVCISSYGRYRRLLRYCFSSLRHLPESISTIERLKMARLVMRNIGINEVIERSDTGQELVLADEGMIQIAHYLFVHQSVAPDPIHVRALIELMPLPPLAIYLRQPTERLVHRTFERGHKRISPPTYANVQLFIERAQLVFEEVVRSTRVQERLLLVEGWGDEVAYIHEPQMDSVTTSLPRMLINKVQPAQPMGAVIAFVGPEATGKSTLVSETEAWLSTAFPADAIHVGKPPSTALTRPLNVWLPALRNLFPQMRTSRIEGHVSSAANKKPPKGAAALVYAFRAVLLAWDRNSLLRQARQRANQGEMVICDRYPSTEVGAMDSARLRPLAGETGAVAAIYNRLVRMEGALYAEIPAPDAVLRLSVSLETAKVRNRDRSKVGKEADGYIESRHRQCREWHWPGTKHIYDISTEQSLEETTDQVKRVIGRALTQIVGWSTAEYAPAAATPNAKHRGRQTGSQTGLQAPAAHSQGEGDFAEQNVPIEM